MAPGLSLPHRCGAPEGGVESRYHQAPGCFRQGKLLCDLSGSAVASGSWLPFRFFSSLDARVGFVYIKNKM